MIESQIQTEAGRGGGIPDASRPGHIPRIVLAHDWLCGYRGGEAVLERIAALVEREFGEAAAAGLYVMFDDRRGLSPRVDAWRARGLIVASSVGSWPWSARLRRWMLPLYRRAVEQLSRGLAAAHEGRRIDLVISTSSAAIKGLRVPVGVPHLCYCHAPARYVWSMGSEYGGTGLRAGLRLLGLRWYSPRFKHWDRETAAKVTRYLANSTHTAREIARCWGRKAEVVPPPVRTGYFTTDATVAREGFWLVAGALEPYKRVDLAVQAAAQAGVALVVAGDGSQRRALRRRAGRGVRFVGRVSDEELRELYRRARLLLFPQVEDFGIVAVEAQACGLPVVARRAGGAVDVVIDGKTGALFDEPKAEAIVAAAARVPEQCEWACRENAARFGEEAFDAAVRRHVREMLALRSSATSGATA